MATKWPYPEKWKEFYNFTTQAFDCSSCEYCEESNGHCEECWDHGTMFSPNPKLIESNPEMLEG